MDWIHLFGAVIAFMLLGYLTVALLNPELFS